jgi:hypothetical protein
LGENVEGKVVLTKAYQVSSPSKSLLSNQELKDNKLNFLAAKPEAGFYELEFTVSPSKSQFVALSKVHRSLKVLTTVSLNEVQLVVSGSADSADAKDSKKYK